MKPERLLKLFDRVAEAPDAVVRLRRLVLDLAVRGKLVAQNSNDEPAKLLLQRIEEQRETSEISAKYKRRAKLNQLHQNNIPFAIPRNWQWSQLAQVGEIAPRNNAPDDLQASFVPMPMIFAEFGKPNQYEIRNWGSIKQGYTHFAEGDVGLAKITPCFENAKSTVFENLTGGLGAGTTELHIVRPILVNPKYILIFLKSPHFIEGGIPKMTGTAGQKRVSLDYFAHSFFPVPPLAEQHRIVQRVDELMAVCDQLEAAQADREQRRGRLSAAALDRLVNAEPDEKSHAVRFYLSRLPRLVRKVEHVQALRRTILNVAVRGRLVEQTLEDTSVYSLLEQAKAIKNSMASHKPEFLILNDENEQLYPIPGNWVWCFMEELFLITGGIQKSPKREPVENHFPYLRVANVQRGKLDLFKIERFELFGDELERLKLKEGDLLIVEGNGSEKEIGRCARWNNEIENCVHQNHLIRCRPLIASTEMYVLRFLNAPAGIEIMKNLAVTTTGLFNLSVGKIKSIPVPLPPQEEQERIIAKVDQLMSLCNQLEISLQTSQQTTNRLLDALIAEALSDSPDPETVEAETQLALSD